jgi:predicted sulfurtransferase
MSWLWTFGAVPELPREVIREECVDGQDKVDTLIVDVRTEGEFARGHIKGAISCSLFPPWSFRDRLRATLTRMDETWETDNK